ncbi:hypothetical protein KP78_37960 [Jeotgalibacillus soli]|uniref:Tyr recombinase domain-containing protein n=2 Tax=Jeotgalibacillus soli TaxID=889306 RepID=A0A0C2VF00_9BACL|nr:hypothetical protein KP78_37960 [Jeotgalibacillus soli]
MTVDAIDFENGMVQIYKTVVKGRGGKRHVKDPKTKRGERTLTLPSIVISKLELLVKEIRIMKFKRGSAYNQKENWLFCNESGEVFYPNTPQRWWKRFCTKTNMRYISLHDLRHTHVSILLFSGVDPNTTSKRIGHASSTFTLDTYGHQIFEADKMTATKLDDVFSPKIHRI